jgi:hypothetical protein
MRGCISLPTQGRAHARYNRSQPASIEICSGIGQALVTIKESTRAAMVAALKLHLFNAASPTSVPSSRRRVDPSTSVPPSRMRVDPPPRTWLHRLDVMCDEALKDDASDGMGSVSRKEFISLVRELLKLVQPRVGGAGVGQ